MHVCPKNEGHLVAADGGKIICRERQDPHSALLCGSAIL
jgi:hypothetical protein